MTSRSDPLAVVDDEFLEQSDEEQVFLRSLADELIAQLEDCEKAMAKTFDDQMMDLDEGNALWALLPAKVRTAIRRGRSGTPQVCNDCGGCGNHTRNCITGGRFA